jgi:hypothetical protein
MLNFLVPISWIDLSLSLSLLGWMGGLEQFRNSKFADLVHYCRLGEIDLPNILIPKLLRQKNNESYSS